MHFSKHLFLLRAKYFAIFFSIIVLLSGCKKFEPVRIFKVATVSVSEVTKNSVLISGNVKDLGSQPITQHGFCVSVEEQPTIFSTHVKQLGTVSATGDYSSKLTDLTPGTTYYVRAYLTNRDSTTYGNSLSFTTSLPDKPTVSTSIASTIDLNSAIVGGNVTSAGGGTVIERGVYYGPGSDPMTTGVKIAIGSGEGSFSTQLTGLTSGQKYYVVAYAINSAGSSNGTIEQFTTPTAVVVATVITSMASSVSETTAIIGGNVSNDGGGTVTERGVYYGTGSDPISTGVKIAIGSGVGEFSSQLTGLSSGQNYYVVAYAINSAGSSNGTIEQFTTLVDNMVTDIDGNIYSTVVIGDQTWMAENLRTARYWNGASIPLISNPDDWGALNFTDKGYGYYNDDASDATTYGALYNWAAAMNGAASSDAIPSGVQGVCPSGWHIPSDAEWKALEIQLGMTATEADNLELRGSTQGGQMKQIGYFNSPNTGASNTSGFNGRGHGTVDYWGQRYYNKGGEGLYWSATESNENRAYSRGLYYNSAAIGRWESTKGGGLAVRCIKN